MPSALVVESWPAEIMRRIAPTVVSASTSASSRSFAIRQRPLATSSRQYS